MRNSLHSQCFQPNLTLVWDFSQWVTPQSTQVFQQNLYVTLVSPHLCSPTSNYLPYPVIPALLVFLSSPTFSPPSFQYLSSGITTAYWPLWQLSIFPHSLLTPFSWSSLLQPKLLGVKDKLPTLYTANTAFSGSQQKTHNTLKLGNWDYNGKKMFIFKRVGRI